MAAGVYFPGSNQKIINLIVNIVRARMQEILLCPDNQAPRESALLPGLSAVI